MITNAGIPQAGIRSRSAKVSGPVKAHSKPVGSGGRRRRVNPLLYALCVVLSSAILAGVGWLLASDLCAYNKEAMTTTVEITADDSIGSVADKLQEAGLIKYKVVFPPFAAVANADEKIGMGTYELNTEMDYRALIMAHGRAPPAI